MMDKARFKRHLMLPEVGEEGQEKLAAGRVLVAGAGGLGSPVLMYLAAAGVGTVGIADYDRVDISNLQRQILYRESDLGRPKTEAAREHLLEMNSALRVETFPEGITGENAARILSGFDVIVDATDHFPTRYLINDTCLLLGKPDVYGAICGFSGQITVFSKDGPCLRCLSPEEPDPAAEPDAGSFGVLGAVAGVIGCLQAAEALKLLLGTGRSLAGRMIFLDAGTMETEEMELPVNPKCPHHKKEYNDAEDAGEEKMEHKLTHFDPEGNAVMVDVAEKEITSRTAVASGIIRVNQDVMEAVLAGTVAKGDVLGVARVAGIMAVKQTPHLIPMCHTLLIAKCGIDFELDGEKLEIKAVCTAKAEGKTGVEMEALTGVSVALLTVYDMCKAIDKRMELCEIHLETKSGGKSGDFVR